MSRDLLPAETAVETKLESYYGSIAKDLGKHAIVSAPTDSDFYLDDGQAFITFDITASKKEAGYVNGVLHKYDLLLDGIAGPNDNIVHFGADETTNASDVISTSQFNPSGEGEGQTLYLTGGFKFGRSRSVEEHDPGRFHPAVL